MYTPNRTKFVSAGFTLIEILIVIGILSVLAAIVLVAVNPAKQFREANDAQRTSNVNAILNAIGQYTVDNKGLGTLSTAIPDTTDPTNAKVIGNGTGEADLCGLLIPEYIAKLPADPRETVQSIPADGKTCTDSYQTGYKVYRNGDRVTLLANGEGGDISVTR